MPVKLIVPAFVVTLPAVVMLSAEMLTVSPEAAASAEILPLAAMTILSILEVANAPVPLRVTAAKVKLRASIPIESAIMLTVRPKFAL